MNLPHPSSKDSFTALSLLDRKELDNLFERCLRKSSLGYTIFGNKPISVETFPRTIRGLMSSQNTTNLTYSPTLLLLEKHIPLFQSNTHILKLDREEDFFNLWAINIRTLRRVLTENIDLLKHCLGQQVDIESLISRLSDNKKKIADVLGQHHLLYSLSFGYGRENSILFHHRAFLEEILNEQLLPPFLPDTDSLTRLHHILDSCELASHLKKFPFTRLFPYFNGISITRYNFPKKIIKPYKIQPPEPRSQFTSFEEEWKWIQDVMWDLRKEYDFQTPFFDSPSFLHMYERT